MIQLRKLVFDGIKKKELEIDDVFLDRLSYELSVIEYLNLAEYFHIYTKIIDICNSQGILRSYGRGSACGSLVNYCLDITKINPLKEGLIFERFLNPSIARFADIDIDIAKSSQKRIIEKLGEELPEYFVRKLAYLPPKTLTNYEKIFIGNTEFSLHPCAVLISLHGINLPVHDWGNESYYVSKDFSVDSQLLDPFKFDILELETLRKLDLIAKQIGPEHHPYTLPLNDLEVFDFFKNGDLTNIFQFSSPKMEIIMSKFRPDSTQDLAMLNAMYRPGPMDNVPNLIHNKSHGFEDFYPGDGRVNKLLQETYGLLVYQETFFRLLNEIAGFSYIEADLLRRRYFRKFTKDTIFQFKRKFTDGCKENSSLVGEEIEQLAQMIVSNLAYAFPKSHSLSYSIIAYWSAYYKTHFAKEFESIFNQK